MDITTKLIEIAYAKPEIERERFLRELPNVVILPDFEEKLFLFLFRNATQKAQKSAALLLEQQERPASSLESHFEIA